MENNQVTSWAWWAENLHADKADENLHTVNSWLRLEWGLEMNTSTWNPDVNCPRLRPKANSCASLKRKTRTNGSAFWHSVEKIWNCQMLTKLKRLLINFTIFIFNYKKVYKDKITIKIGDPMLVNFFLCGECMKLIKPAPKYLS